MEWEDIDGTKVAELSILEHQKLAINGIIELPGFAGTFRLQDATPDKTGGDIAGWRFEKDGQKYLVIND